VGERERLPVAARVRSHRARLRARGLRPVQTWVADVRAPQFAAAAHVQSAAIAASEADADDQAFVDAISWDQDDDRGNPGGDPGAEPAGDPGAQRRQ